LKNSRSGNPYCSKSYCRNGYCGIVAAVSELTTFLTRTRSPVFLADDERQCVDANPSACRLLGVSRSQLIARPLDDWLLPDQPEPASDRGRLAAA
jgi:PAS domain-containing protein